MSKKKTSVTKNEKPTTAKTQPVKKPKINLKTFLHSVKTALQSKKARIISIVCAVLALLFMFTVVLATKIPAWQYAKAYKAYLKALQTGIDKSTSVEVLVPNAEVSNLTDDKVRDLLFAENIFSAEAFDSDIKEQEQYKKWSEYTHETIPLYGLIEILASPAAVDVEEDIISLTSYIINNIGNYDLTVEGLYTLTSNYTYNIIVIENLINAQTYVDKVYKDNYETYSSIPDSDHISAASPLELKAVYENFIINENLYANIKTVSTNIHRILEAYYYNIIQDYQTSVFGSSDLNRLNTSYFAEGATNLYDLLYQYYLAAVDYEVLGTYHNLYVDDADITAEIQSTTENMLNKLGYCAVYYGLTTDPNDTFNVFEKFGSMLAKTFTPQKEKDNLKTKVYQSLSGYTTLGNPLTDDYKSAFTGEFGFWNVMFEAVNTSPEALAPNHGIYICTSNLMNGTAVNMTLLPKTMIFNGEENSETVRNLCWSKGIESFYAGTMTAAGVTIDEESGATTIPDDLTDEQRAAVELIYAWVNYATRFAVQ